MTDKAVFNQLILGKQMYYNRTRGGCTSYSILASTIYRSLGIPTRTIITTKIRTTEKYLQMVNKLKNPIMKNIFKNTNKTQGNHFLNEVYIGDRWIRIDYTEFGFGSIHIDRGIFFQHYTLNDISKIDMVKYFGEMVYSNDSGPFKNGELIQIVDISDMYGGYYTPKYLYGINPATLDTYFLFGAREFCKYAEFTVLANISKFKNMERGKSGSINYLKHEYFKEGNLIIISTDNEYMKLPVLVRNKITKKE